MEKLVSRDVHHLSLLTQLYDQWQQRDLTWQLDVRALGLNQIARCFNGRGTKLGTQVKLG